MHLVKRLGLVLAVVSALSLADLFGVQAQISPIGPFVGSLTETWEGFDNYTVGPNYVDYLADPTDIMGGAASISYPFMAVYEPGVANYNLGFRYAPVSDGAKGMGCNMAVWGVHTAKIVFDDPVDSFGAYWGALIWNGTAPISLSFFDVFDVLIGNTSFQYDPIGSGDLGLHWHGWSSTIPIKSLTFTGDYVVIDGLQAQSRTEVPEPRTEVPEPGTLAMLVGMGIGGALVLVRRRRS